MPRRPTATIPAEYGFCHAEQRGNAARNCPVPTTPLSTVTEIINSVHRMGGVIPRSIWILFARWRQQVNQIPLSARHAISTVTISRITTNSILSVNRY